MLLTIQLILWTIIICYFTILLLCISWLVLARSKKGIWYKISWEKIDLIILLLSFIPIYNSILSIHLWNAYPIKH
jgi:hypothetical protein